jgi:hypothetical protein
VDDILDFFARTMELTGGTFRVELHDVVANDEHAVALYVARGEREGKTQEDKSVLRQPCLRQQVPGDLAALRGSVRGRRVPLKVVIVA